MRTKATAQNTTTTMATVMVTTMARTTGKSVRHPHLSTCTPHIAPGAALALGFAFMLVVDHVSGSYGHGTYTVKSILLTALFRSQPWWQWSRCPSNVNMSLWLGV